MADRQDPVINEVAFVTVYSDANHELRRGTGFLVKLSGHFIVVTAAHCLYDVSERKWADYVQLFSGRETENASPVAEIRLPYFYIPDSYMIGGSGNESEKLYGENDFGFIYLCQAEDFPRIDWFELVILDEAVIAKADMHITGYPKQVQEDGPVMFSQYSLQVVNAAVDTETDTLTQRQKEWNSMTEGMDGAPCYYTSGRKRYAFGVHVRPGCAEVRFTKKKIKDIEKAVKDIAALRTVPPKKSGIVCGVVWRPNYMAYRCETCAIFKHSLFCHGCFNPDRHIGHRYDTQLCKTGGFCNCGDTDMMKSEGNPHDDAILVAESVVGLQTHLKILERYGKGWKLSVNLDKTNIVIFRKGKTVSSKEKCTLDGKPINIILSKPWTQSHGFQVHNTVNGCYQNKLVLDMRNES